VVARGHTLATVAGRHALAVADLTVAADTAGLAAPGCKGVWLYGTPTVSIARSVSQQRAMEQSARPAT